MHVPSNLVGVECQFESLRIGCSASRVGVDYIVEVIPSTGISIKEECLDEEVVKLEGPGDSRRNLNGKSELW